MKKKYLALLLCIMMVCSVLASCHTGDPSASTTDPTETSAPGETSEPQTSEPETSSVATTEEPPVPPEDLMDFDDFISEVMLDVLEDDLIGINSFFLDASSVGYVRPDGMKASFYTYEEDYLSWCQEDYEYCLEKQQYMKYYDYDSLTKKQKQDYDALEFAIDLSLRAEAPGNPWMMLTAPAYISQYGGYVAEFASVLENYKLRNEQDVVDLIDIIRSSRDCFASYTLWLKDRKDTGFPLSDYTLNKMDEYLGQILEAGEDSYLIPLLCSQVEALDFLTSAQKNEYTQNIQKAIVSEYLPAVRTLKESMKDYFGVWSGEGESYLSHYGEKADGYYNYILCSTLGVSEIDVEQYVTDTYNAYYDAYMLYTGVENRISRFSEEDMARFNDMLESTENFLGCSSPEELLQWLLDKSSSLVSPLKNNPEITVKYSDEIASQYAEYLAYYTLSPVDEQFSPVEYVTLNPLTSGNLSDLVFVLSHEGYPGHLYAHALSKQEDVSALALLMRSEGSSEGWAQYAAYQLLKNFASSSSDNVEKNVANYLASMTYLNYTFSAYMDAVINGFLYNAQGLTEIGMPLEEGEELVHSMDESPATYAGYGYGMNQMIALHQSAKSKCGSAYSEQEFNSYIISNNGLFSMDSLYKAVDAYIAEHS